MTHASRSACSATSFSESPDTTTLSEQGISASSEESGSVLKMVYVYRTYLHAFQSSRMAVAALPSPYPDRADRSSTTSARFIGQGAALIG